MRMGGWEKKHIRHPELVSGSSMINKEDSEINSA
jgi:hypothetical protein